MRLLITGGSGFIGTNVIEEYLSQGVELINLDWNPPLNQRHEPYWRECNIMDYPHLTELFHFFQPTHVLHLAARTDTDIYELDGDLKEYIQNTEGTQNIIHCIHKTPSVERVIITSSMFVCRAGHVPKSDIDYKPFTLYGVSKKLTEEYTRSANLACTWTIIRPQTIWGPWSLRYRDVMFKVMKRGLYFHPNKQNVRRAYGYVGNVVWQIHKIFSSPAENVHAQVYYVGDEAIDLKEWVELVAIKLTGKPVRILPTFFVKCIARFGDLMKESGKRFPLSSSRFDSMTQNYLTPITKTIQTLGKPPYDIKQGVEHFVEWYNHEESQVPQLEGRKVKVVILN